MPRAAIYIDTWKLPIFQRHLDQAGYKPELGAGVTDDTLLLTVDTTNLIALQVILQWAAEESAMTGPPPPPAPPPKPSPWWRVKLWKEPST